MANPYKSTGKLIRCSWLPRIMQCPASANTPDIQTWGDGSPLGRVGTAIHDVCAMMLKNQSESLPNLQPFIAAHELEGDEKLQADLFFCVRTAFEIWQDFKETLKILNLEEQMQSPLSDGFTLGGTADLIAEDVSDESLVVWDYKSGYLDKSYIDQLMGYISLASMRYPAYTQFKAVIVWLRRSEVEVQEFSLDDLVRWRQRLAEVLANPNAYQPGEACQFCPARITCTARRELIGRASEELLGLTLKGASADDLALAAMYDRAKLVSSATAKYFDLLREAVTNAGTLPMPDGRALTLGERQMPKISFLKSQKPLMKFFGITKLQELFEKIQTSLRVTKGGLEKIAAVDAGKGEKGKRKAAMFKALKDAGAVAYTVTHTIQVIRQVPDEKKEK